MLQLIMLDDYWMGRHITHAHELTPEILAAASETVLRWNFLQQRAAEDGVYLAIDRVTGTHVASGWRPQGINARTANASKTSHHIWGRALDGQDWPDRRFAAWTMLHLDVAAQIGLWFEDPRWTGGADPWLHGQIVPPRGGAQYRVYIPSNTPPIAAALPGQVV